MNGGVHVLDRTAKSPLIAVEPPAVACIVPPNWPLQDGLSGMPPGATLTV